MSLNTVTQLPPETTKLITSTQIITSVSTAVKELVENAIDAGGKVIQVRLENFGLDLIEVKDDGSGVSYDNVQRMFLPGYTSKIRQFEDLDRLHSYGFRGEALAALCKLGKITITTKTALDTLAMTYDIDSSGLPLTSKPSHLNKGTVITVNSLFANVPVRRLYLSSKKKMTEELKKTEQVIQSLSLIHPELGVSVIHNKCSIWKKNSVKGIKQSFMQVAGLKTVSKMECLNKVLNQISLDIIIPKKGLENPDNVFTNSPHSIYVYVNKRPVNCKNLSQPVQEHIFQHFSNLNLTFKYAVSLISVDISPQQLDINLEPNKTKILLKNQTEIIKLIDETLCDYYGHQNFMCSALKEAIIEKSVGGNEDDDGEDEEKRNQSKRPRLQIETCDKSVGEKRTQDFLEKNSDWHLEIINDDCAPYLSVNVADIFEKNEKPGPQSLCSQINRNNCVLTTEEEVCELNAILSETNLKLVTSTNSKNSETRLIDRNDLQSRNAGKILKEWPSRPKITIEPQLPSSNVNKSDSLASENQIIQEMAKEIEKDAVQWSNEMAKATAADKNLKQDGLNSTVSEEDIGQFDLSMQSISSQMGKKEMKAFTKFARIMRPKITQEFPNMVFTQVAAMLAERWKGLSPEEVKYYEKVAEVVDVNRKIYQESKENELRKPPVELNKPKMTKNSNKKTLLEQMKERSKLNRPPRKEMPFFVSLRDVKKAQKSSINDEPADRFEVIGQLHPSGNWLYRKGKEIGHIRHQGLQELITSQKMLATHSIPRKALEKPILVTEENLGTILWNVLISLESKYDLNTSKTLITSEVITKNGFLIEINKTDDVISSANITEVALPIPHYGISELKDALKMYQKNGDFGGLANWRPTSVCNYITNEAIRLSQASSKPPRREDLENMMNTYHLCLRHLPPVCLHSKEIFSSFYQLETSSQLST